MNIKDLFSKIKTNDAWTGKDKNLHFVGAWAMMFVFTFFLHLDLQIAMLVAVGIAFLKEIVYDLVMDKGTCSLQDFLVTCAGVVAYAVVYKYLLPGLILVPLVAGFYR